MDVVLQERTVVLGIGRVSDLSVVRAPLRVQACVGMVNQERTTRRACATPLCGITKQSFGYHPPAR